MSKEPKMDKLEEDIGKDLTPILMTLLRSTLDNVGGPLTDKKLRSLIMICGLYCAELQKEALKK